MTGIPSANISATCGTNITFINLKNQQKMPSELSN